MTPPTRCCMCSRLIRATAPVLYPVCASCAEYRRGGWEPVPWRNAAGMWSLVVVGCGLWALGLAWLLS